MPAAPSRNKTKPVARKGTARKTAAAKREKREKRTFLFEVVVKSESGNPPEFKPGMGKGVLYSVEVGFNETPQTYDSDLFAMHLLDRRDEIIKQAVECRITPVTAA